MGGAFLVSLSFFLSFLFLSLIVFLLRLVMVELSCRWFVESLDYLRGLLR